MDDDGDGGGGGDGGRGDADVGGGDSDVTVVPMLMVGLLEHPVLCSHRVLRNEFSIWLGYIVLSRILQTKQRIGSLGGSEGKGMAFPSVA